MRTGDWIARTLMLVLSGLSTFAILASIESAIQTAHLPLPAGIEASPEPGNASGGVARQPPRADAANPADDTAVAPGSPTTATDAAMAAQAARDSETARWLRALTYAVLALAGFAAAALVALLRIGSHLGRIADRSGA